mmetsp:Transcript_36114/g.103741  ORF Transcript_36114/g.103741 Transcript_36114/m.103741 type:complete len:82 (+) Transcript_36114:449-694(+)
MRLCKRRLRRPPMRCERTTRTSDAIERLSDAVRLMAELDKSAWQHTREAILSDSNTTMTQKVARVEEVDAKMKQLRKRLVA